MTAGWVYLFACVSFACAGGVPVVQGDGAYYATRPLCERAARADARRWGIDLRSREIVCVPRSTPQ